MRALLLLLTGCNIGLQTVPNLLDSGYPPLSTDDTAAPDNSDTDSGGEACLDDDSDGVTTCDGDCDDDDSSTFPGAAPDDSPSACMTDADGDGYGADSPASGVSPGTDCNDANSTLNPAAAETEFDGVDSNCDGEDGGSIVTASGQGGMAINDYSTTTSSASVSGCSSITDFTVNVSILHTYIGDLRVTLSPPSGPSVLLHNATGSTTDDLIGTYTPSGGTLASAQSLMPVLGTNGNGQWQLSIADGAGGDTGTLSSWSLDLVCP
ncbi:MAG: proprotein convertase P-domain-containing protein [Myxococcota bacterium]|nr:proprotein convertase P-domain-containing protein [Myxococcota bacterium]